MTCRNRSAVGSTMICPSSIFIDEPTIEGTPRIYTLANSEELVYRLYNENVNSTAICSEIPPASPTVLEEYKALPGGQIQITTSVLPSVNETTKATTINYIHQIKLINVQFTNGENNLIYEELKSKEIENNDVKRVIKTYESTLIKLESIENQYNISGIEEKRKLIGSIFPKKFQFENKKVRTADINPLFLKISSINSASQRIKKRQIQKKLNLSGMVGNEGFEPPTPSV